MDGEPTYTRCSSGDHEMSPDNTTRWKSGGPRCRECRNVAARKYRAKKMGYKLCQANLHIMQPGTVRKLPDGTLSCMPCDAKAHREKVLAAGGKISHHKPRESVVRSEWCSKGLHRMEGDNLAIMNDGRRRCVACRTLNVKRKVGNGALTEAQMEMVVLRYKLGATAQMLADDYGVRTSLIWAKLEQAGAYTPGYARGTAVVQDRSARPVYTDWYTL